MKSQKILNLSVPLLTKLPVGAVLRGQILSVLFFSYLVFSLCLLILIQVAFAMKMTAESNDSSQLIGFDI
jgi:hypothetical protein